MSWATGHVQKLQAGETVQFRPRGPSMAGKVNDGDLVTVVPLGTNAIEKGAIVLCKVKGRQYLHLVHAVRGDEARGERYLIGNNRGGLNGWIGRDAVYGICTKVER